ncbi:hypothetical protein EHQ61_19475 [Leptospira wolffii]|uniref:Omp85 family outer membrane protein n=1 Tax=Leptospira wolffii TaxID=409998 RepID=UPI0010843CF6|nr:DUF5982 domain-containing protein [Leptospira wolffii]TGL45441.1 hypothetical protein EHQ61_19475 [Leptospira wolffii]
MFLRGFLLFCLVFASALVADERVAIDLSESKRLSKSELEEKREGMYLTGLPVFSEDPVRGQGYGARGYLYQNGNRSDPYFEFQPYKYRFGAQAYKTTKGAEYYEFTFDSPFLFDTAFRLKTSVSYSTNKNSQYFGIGTSTMRDLTYRERNQPDGTLKSGGSFSAREDALSFARPSPTGSVFPYESNREYNTYEFKSTTATFSIDETFWKAFRWIVAPELSQNVIRTFDYPNNRISGKSDYFSPATDPNTGWGSTYPNGTSKLTEDYQKGLIHGFHGGYVNYVHMGIAYDTRDFEPDPDSGVLLEMNYTASSKRAGSDFEFEKFFAQGKFFYMPFPKIFEELVIGGRAALHYTKGEDVPFSEYRYMWSIDGPINGLGGLQTLRGYRQERFIAPMIGFGNLEVRWRFGTMKFWDQLVTLSLVPFYDFGRVWDGYRDIGTIGYKFSYGTGLRIVWNQATVILIDYGKSREDSQLFIDVGHIF